MFDRTISKIVEKTSKGFPVVLLTGMRQIGKSWIVEHLAGKDRKYITLDDMAIREFAKRDPKGFIAEYTPPIVIDEVQYAPELFPYIKMYVDKHKQDGLYWLTGSQQYNLMDKVKESLAGRVGILDMLGLSYKEIIGKAFYSKPFLPSNYNKPLNMEDENQALNLSKLYKIIWNGSFPKPLDNPDTDRAKFYSSYIRTYIERDVKDSLGIKNDLAFYDFIRSVASRTGNMLVLSDIAKDVGIDIRSVGNWLSILEKSGIVKLLEPYTPNITGRIVKTPKLYFLDTGLASYLVGWTTSESLMNGAMNGAILETYVFAEILKSYWHNGLEPNIYYYRDKNNKDKEIDFVLVQDMTFYPIEVKRTANPSKNDYTNLSLINTLAKKQQYNVGKGVVLCLYPNILPLDKNILSIPVWEI